MKNALLFFVACLFVMSCGQSPDNDFQKQLAEANKKIIELEKQINEQSPPRVIADTPEEYKKLVANPKVQIIRSVNDFDKISNAKVDVFGKLDVATLTEFKKDLQFKNGQLISANYGVIQKKLSRSEFKRFWNRFGLSLDLIADHEGYECLGGHNCAARLNYICMDGC